MLKDILSNLTVVSFLAVINSTVFWYTPRKRNARSEQVALAQELVTFALQGLGAKVPVETLENWEN